MNLSVSEDTLRRTPLFKNVESWIINEILENGIALELAIGKILFQYGEAYQQRVFLFCEGELEIQRHGIPSRYAIPGYLLGLANYLDSSAYTSTAIAASAAKLIALPDALLRHFESKSKIFVDSLNALVVSRIRKEANKRKVDSGPLSQPVRKIMKSPLLSCIEGTKIKHAFMLMQERHIGSLCIRDQQGKLKGIVTFKDIANALIEDKLSSEQAVKQIKLKDINFVDVACKLWQAEERLEKYATKYIVATDNGSPVGMISQTDVMHAMLGAQHSLISDIHNVTTLDELVVLTKNIQIAIVTAYQSNRSAVNAVRNISDLHLAYQHRCVELSLQQMEDEGLGPAPVAYALIIMGSGGRQEMIVSPDQDNGIILDDSMTAPQREWFKQFSERININLDKIGYVLCPGNIMARNPMFHKTLKEWKDQISKMVNRPNDKAARWSNIVFDFNTLYGDEGLVQQLRHHVHAALGNEPLLLSFMVKDDAEGRPPIGFFNRFVMAREGERKGKIDIKRNGLRIIADAARILALSNQIATCNTNERLNALVRMGVISSELVDGVKIAYEQLLDILLSHQIEQIQKGVKIDKLVDPEKMPYQRREALRISMRATKRFQDYLQASFDLVLL